MRREAEREGGKEKEGKGNGGEGTWAAESTPSPCTHLLPGGEEMALILQVAVGGM